MSTINDPQGNRSWVKRSLVVTVAGLVVAMLVVASNGGIQFKSKAESSPSPSDSVTQSPSEFMHSDVSQCHMYALAVYMDGLGYPADSYVVGEDNIDWAKPALLRHGTNSVGGLIKSREELGQLFSSTDETGKNVVSNLESEFPDIDRIVLFDPSNWEVVQVTIPTTIAGNTAMVNGKIKSVGDTSSEAGDAMWFFVEPTTCKVAMSDDGASVAAIRPGCTNPTNGFGKNPALDPAQQGNAPEGAGQNQDQGPGDETGTLTGPGPNPRPSVVPPTVSGIPTGSTPDPTSAPTPEVSAPTEENPAKGTSCAPGISVC